MAESPVLVVAGPEHAHEIIQKLKKSEIDARAASVVDLNNGRWLEHDAILIVGPGIDREIQFHLFDRLQGAKLRLLFYAPEFERLTDGLGSDFSGIRCISIPTSSPWPGYDLRRRFIDIVFSVSVIIGILFPLTLILGLIIRLTSRGPVFYSTTVVGQGGRPFIWRKFRSMRQDEDADAARKSAVSIARSLRGRDDSGSTKVVDRARVTFVGRVIRKTSIDELPQFINVLKGDMTLVGPRPSLPYEFNEAAMWQKRRAIPQAGITGIWGVFGRSIVHFDEQSAMDICGYYRRSTFGDLVLVLKTALIAARGKGAE